MNRKELRKMMKKFGGKTIPKKLFLKDLKELGLKIIGSTLEDSPDLSSQYYYVSDKSGQNSILVGINLDDQYGKITEVNTSMVI